MADFKIHVNENDEKEDYMLVVIMDVKYKTEASFALPRELKHAAQLRMIKSALAKVKFLNDTTIEERKAKAEKKLVKTLKKVRKENGNDIVFMSGKKPTELEEYQESKKAVKK